MHLRPFFLFWKRYLTMRTLRFGEKFEMVKNTIVALLLAKRGKYSTSFINSTLFLLVITAVIAGPIIAENNPFASEVDRDAAENQQSVFSYDPYENSLSTIISSKPRDKVVAYEVKGGDTIASIAKKFAVSIDTIKWENSLKTDTIKPGETLNIPPGTGIVHKVNSGETIYSIAKKYNVDAQNIVNFPFNDYSDLETFALATGQSIFVPEGTIEQKKPAAPNSGGYYAGAIQAGSKGSSSFIWPTSGGVTQYPIWYHMALDIASGGSPPIIAADGGTVTYAGCIDWGYGCHIIIDHGNGYQSLYGHMSQLLASPGQVVGKGSQIGVMGSTGRSTGPHLHFEIRQGGALLNPLSFLQ